MNTESLVYNANGRVLRDTQVSTQRKSSKATSGGNNTVLSDSLKQYRESFDYQKNNWFAKWERDNRLYDSERAAQSYIGLADTFVPMTFPMIETMVTALANGSLNFDYKFGDPMINPDIRTLNGLIDEWGEKDNWDLASEESIREMLITGMAGNMLSWEIDHPHWDYGSMRDYIVDPTIKSPADLQKPEHYAGRRYLVRKGSLDDYKVVDVDPKSKTYGELINRYNIPKDSGYTNSTNLGSEELDKQVKEMTLGSTLSSAQDDQDEIIEIWNVDKVRTILNRSHVIEDVINPYKQRHEDILTQKYYKELYQSFIDQRYDPVAADQEATKMARAQAKDESVGLVPFFFFRNYRRSSTFYAKSEIDSIAKHQELLNDMSNLETDMIIKKNSPQRELDPEYADFIDLVNEDPDTIYPFRPGSLRFVDQPVSDGSLFNNRMNVKNEIREATAIGQGAKGIESSKDKTAEEVRSVDRGTSSRIESKARILEKDAYFWMAHILYRMAQLYVTTPQVVRVKGPSSEGKESGVYKDKQLPKGTAVYDPADYDSDFIPHVTLEIDAEDKKIEEKQQAQSEYKILISDPTNNIAEVKKIYYPKMFDLDKADLDRILTPPQQAEAQQQAMLPEGQPI